MFGPPAIFYIYLVYGMHWMLNIVTEKEGCASAVLIRGIVSATGPARVTNKLKIDKSLNAKLAHPQSNVWFEDRGYTLQSKNIMTTPRIGVNYAGPIWSKKKLRFVIRPLSSKVSSPSLSSRQE